MDQSALITVSARANNVGKNNLVNSRQPTSKKMMQIAEVIVEVCVITHHSYVGVYGL